MSIKQGDYLKSLRQEHKLSQEQLGEILGISRQSVSKWEQGSSAPDIENLTKLSKYYGVSLDSLVNGEPDDEADETAEEKAEEVQAVPEEIKPEPVKVKDEKAESPKPRKKKKKKHWIYAAYPVLTAIAYCIIGTLAGGRGWALGWLVFLTIPLFYTGAVAIKRNKPVIFCYPVLVLLIFLMLGFFYSLWHPTWILFLTIPLFYIIAARK